MALVDIPRVPVNVGNVVRALVSALSNMRLKLTAPVVCGRIAFVNIPVRRRSLGAIR